MKRLTSKRTFHMVASGLIFSSLLFALVVLPALGAEANDETNQDEVNVQATLDEIDCGATPPTIKVLGLTIDISKASLINSSADGQGSGNLTCGDLAVGQMAEVTLVSDTAPLSATEVDAGGGDCEDDVCGVKIAAPLQAIDLNVPSVTVLGLVVDISGASLEGDNSQPIMVGQLMVGQVVELTLASKQPPLVATTLQVRNSTNEVDVEVIDEKGNSVDDAVDDVQVDAAVKSGKKVLRFHTTSNGSFNLAGLPVGRAKIVVTRVHNGHTSRAKFSAKVKANSTQHFRIRLQAVR